MPTTSITWRFDKLPFKSKDAYQEFVKRVAKMAISQMKAYTDAHPCPQGCNPTITDDARISPYQGQHGLVSIDIDYCCDAYRPTMEAARNEVDTTATRDGLPGMLPEVRDESSAG